MTLLRFAAACALALLLVAPATMATGTASRTYVNSAFGTCASGVLSVNQGAVCFPLAPTDTSAHIEIADAVSANVAGTWTVNVNGNVPIATGTFCGSGDATWPAGAINLRVTFSADTSGACGLATTGTVTATVA